MRCGVLYHADHTHVHMSTHVVKYIHMDIHTSIPLKKYTTMRLGGSARFMTDVHTPAEVQQVYQNATSRGLRVHVLGSGSNTIVRDEGFDGLVVRVRIPGFEVVADDLNTTTIKVGAGEDWDAVVKRTVDMRLSGIEAMSAIPGTTGAAPVQNVGAYGQEIADTLVELEAYDTENNTFVRMNNEACGFSYRHSIFRDAEYGRYIITSITLTLSKNAPSPPFYDALQKYFDERGTTMFTHDIVRQAVIDIRHDKLPNPDEKPNAGSFFKNAVVEDWQLKDIRKEHSDIPTFDMPDGRYKVPTGWLIEQTGLKGTLLHGMRVHDKNALVLINESAESYADLAVAREEIIGAVRDQFRIMIEQEPLEI